MQEPHIRPLTCVFAALAFAACAPDERPAAGDLSAFDDLFALESRVLLEVNPDDPLGRPGELTEWAGRIAVVDRFGRNVKVFATDGSLLFTLGRPGDGPGEFRAPLALAVVSGDRLAVADTRLAKVTLFQADGEVQSEFRIAGAAIGGLEPVDGGHGLLISAKMLGEDGREASPYSMHLLDLGGAVENSFGERPEPKSVTEAAFHQVGFAVAEDTLVVSCLMARSTLFRTNLAGLVLDSLQIAGIPEPDWEHAPRTPGEIVEWTAKYLIWMMGIIPVKEGYVVRFQGGDAQRGQEWQQYVVVDKAFSQTGMTDRTNVAIVGVNGAGELLGIDIADDGEAYLSTYRLIPPVAL